MLDSYALDSSVLVVSLIPSDKHYNEGTILVDRLLSTGDIVYASSIVPVEVCAALARRTKDKVSARGAQMQIAKWISLGRLRISHLNTTRMRRAPEIGIECYVCGMDAIIVQVAKEKKVPLVTFGKLLQKGSHPSLRLLPNIRSNKKYPRLMRGNQTRESLPTRSIWIPTFAA